MRFSYEILMRAQTKNRFDSRERQMNNKIEEHCCDARSLGCQMFRIRRRWVRLMWRMKFCFVNICV